MNQYLQTLVEHGYVPEIAAICRMQGESDTAPEKSARYLENQTALLTYLRQDLAHYDSLSQFMLDREFGKYLVQILSNAL